MHLCEAALRDTPASADGWRLRGTIAFSAGKLEQARESFETAVPLPRAGAEPCFGLGVVLEALGDFPGASRAYADALLRDPTHYGALLNATALALARRDPESASALSEDLLAAHRDRPDAWLNRAQVLMATACFEEARALLDDALRQWPEHLGLRFSKVNALAMIGQVDAAESEVGSLRAMNLPAAVVASIPGAGEAIAFDRDRLAAIHHAALFERLKRADWNAGRELRDALSELAIAVRAGPAKRIHPVQAYQAMAIGIPLGDYLELVAGVSRYVAASVQPLPAAGAATGKRRLRLAYLSPSFRAHPNVFLFRGLIAAHDRQRFEVFAYSTGEDDRSPERAEIVAAADRFVDLRALDDPAAALRIREDGIDILIDLGGYFDSSRPGILARRPAKIQVSYTGMLGIVQAPFIDYRLADRVTDGQYGKACFPFEQPAYLPGCLMPYGPSTRPHSLNVRRAECGLPEDGIVLCGFHTDYKISDETYSAWLAILRGVPRSVLWLIPSSDAQFAALCAQAARAGVAPERLVAAPRVGNDDHVARLACADLFLDAFAYNAHTTAFEALWMGLPVLTCPGDNPAARVCTSALLELGLPELVARGPDDYVRRAVQLAGSPEARTALSNRLVRSRDRAALFQPAVKARQIERALEMMWQRREEGRPPAAIDVPGPTAPGEAPR